MKFLNYKYNICELIIVLRFNNLIIRSYIAKAMVLKYENFGIKRTPAFIYLPN